MSRKKWLITKQNKNNAININKPYVLRIISNGKTKINIIIIHFLVGTLHKGQGYSEMKSNNRYKKKKK